MNFYLQIIFVAALFVSLCVPPVAASDRVEQRSVIHLGHVQLNQRRAKHFVCDGNSGEALLAGDFSLDKNTAESLNRLGLVCNLDQALERFVLYRGRLLLASHKPVRLLLANADLEIAANSVVYVSDDGAGTCEILNLHDEHRQAVLVRVGETQFELPPGRQVLLSSNLNREFDELNLCAGLRFRGANQLRPVPTIKGLYSQYALPSAIQILPAINRLAKSKTREANRVLKTAAAVYAASGYPNDFCTKVDVKSVNAELERGTANGGVRLND
jgi:hypothetical protein